MPARDASNRRRANIIRVATALLITLLAGVAIARAQESSKTTPSAMVPMSQVGPQSRSVDFKKYARVIRVATDGELRTVGSALASVTNASPENRHAILVAAGTYKESRIVMKPYVDLYGGFAPGDRRDRDVYRYAAILDAQTNGPVVIGADHARLDGFLVTGGEQKAHGGGIVCDGTSPTIANNIIAGNHTLKTDIGEGLGKQIGNEGAGIMLSSGSRAYVSNNLICENTTDLGAGAGISARGNVHAKILRNVFCNNMSGVKDDSVFHGKVGSRSSPGAAIACSAGSSPQISFNVIVLGSAVLNNDAGGIWVEGNSMPPIRYNWIAGNTSGDDGGGIYVMGDLYYDEAGVRHDTSPDGPTTIEDNLIAGNHTVRGGPGGVRASRFGRVDLRRNRIIGNDKGGAHGAEGGLICVMEDNVIADNGSRKEPPRPSFRLTGDITSRKFDELRHVTDLTAKDLGDKDLSGAVVRIGVQWSVVESSGPGRLGIWGKITDQAAKVEILDHYAPKE